MARIDEFLLWLRVDRSAAEPLAAQLAAALRSRILAGSLGAGEPLPPSRELAASLGIARSVVVRAYEQLLGEGYLESRSGSATRVASGIIPAPDRPPSALPASQAQTLPDPDASGPAPIDLRTGNPFVPAEPPTDWRRSVASAARRPLSSYAPPPLGEPALREAIATHLRRARGLACSPDDVIITAGTADALLTVGLALGGGTRVAMEDPGYPEAGRVLRLAGLELLAIPVSAEGVERATLARLSPAPGAVLVTPSHQFPLGGRMPAAERTALVAWAAARGAVVIEDDYDSEFRHTGPALPAIAALDPGGVVAHLGSLNKTISPSIRCGYVVATSGSRLHASLVATRSDMGGSTPALTQYALAEFFATGAYQRYLARTKREYRHRREILLSAVARLGWSDRLSATDGGLHAVLRLPRGMKGAELVARLRSRNVIVESITEFVMTSAGAGSRRTAPPPLDEAITIGYGAEATHRLQRGIDEIARTIGEISRETRASRDSA